MSRDFLIGRPEDSESVEQAAAHTLWVEGDERSDDYIALNELLHRLVAIRGLGVKSQMTSVAKAMHGNHQSYYFLVDRDAFDDDTVERSWANFPDPTQNNLLIWRRKEIENYFIDPDFVTKSEFFQGERNEYIKQLQQEATRRVYFDAVNRVIVEVREQVKASWIDCLRYHDTDFQNADGAQARLLACQEFATKVQTDGQLLHENNLQTLFQTQIQEMLGGMESCVYGTGRWLELMCGKELFHALIGTRFFKVEGRNGRQLSGRDKRIGLIKSLVRLPDPDLPADFVQLKQLIQRVTGPE
jgi:hypothetical protein